MTPLESLLGPDDMASIASVELRSAVETAPGADGVRPLVADGDGFEVIVTAPAGSQVLLANGWRARQFEVADEPILVEVEASRGRQEGQNQPLAVTLVVMTREGRVSTAAWEGLYLRELPELTVNGSTETLALAARLEGHATPGTAVTANGQPVETDSEGRFAIRLDAPIWPSAVTVVARDALGNEARAPRQRWL